MATIVDLLSEILRAIVGIGGLYGLYQFIQTKDLFWGITTLMAMTVYYR